MVDEKVFLLLFLVDGEKVERFLKDLAELDFLRERKLRRDPSLVRTLRAVNDDLLGRRHVGCEQYGRVDLK